MRNEDRERRIAAEVIRSMSEAVTVFDLDFHFSSVNAAFTRMSGYGDDEVRGRNTSLLNCTQQPDSVYAHMRRELHSHGHWRGELWQRRKNGSDFLCWVELREVCNAHGTRTHYVGVMTDITDRKRAEQELRYLANYDMLTGLPNRTLLGERLGDAILRARRSGHRLAVLYVDLDRFKHVNDSMGHTTGDRLLKAAGARLRQCVREQDTVARVGGDEFTLVLEDVGGSGEVIGVAHKIISAFNEALVLDPHQEVLISPSIGISLYPDHGQVPNELLKHADTAMYQAKEHGRNTWMIYNDTMDADARLRATMAGALRRALERNETAVVYQPKMALDDHAADRRRGAGALEQRRTGRGTAQSIFIPLAEETGMIMDIGQFVLEQACSDLQHWRRSRRLDKLTMAVNLSMVQLQRSGLAKRLQHTLAGIRRAGRTSGTGADREHGHGQRRAVHAHPGRAARHRRQPGHRRFRHRLLLAGLPQAPAADGAEDRPGLRRRHHHRPRRRGHHRHHHHHGALARPAGGRRGRGDRRTGRHT